MTQYLDGTRRTEKHDDFALFDGQHEAIIPPEEWDEAHRLRQATGRTTPKTHSLDHEHILSGILRCPVCGAPMYGSVNRKQKKDGSFYKDSFYYTCANRKSRTGTKCTFPMQPPQDAVNAEVIAVVAAAVRSPTFAGTMQAEMNTRTDEDTVRSRLESLEAARRQRVTAKDRLAQQLDSLDASSPAYDMMYEDMNRRLQTLYDQLLETDRELAEARADLSRLNENRATLEQAYRMLVSVSETLPSMTDAEKKELIRAFIDEVQIFEERQPDGRWVKAVHFRFPVMMEPGTETEWWRSEAHDKTRKLLR